MNDFERAMFEASDALASEGGQARADQLLEAACAHRDERQKIWLDSYTSAPVNCNECAP